MKPTHDEKYERIPSARIVLAGFLMGLANLVPGVSGGTMILAMGLYDRFIGAVAEFTSFRWSRATFFFLCLMGVGLVVAVVGLATPAVWLVTTHRWAAYSLFIGMTLGGVPLLWKAVRPLGPSTLVAIAAGLGVMAWVALGLDDSSLPHTFLVFLVVGAIAASSMILPGISGSYVLLIFGLYDVVIGSMRPGDLLEDPGGALGVLVPVMLGVALGVGALSNVLKLFLRKCARPAHGVLLGLLLGSVLGLWPFQTASHPELVTKDGVKSIELLLAGEPLPAIESETGVHFEPDRADELRREHAGRTKGDLKLLGLRLERYRPSLVRAALAAALAALGFLVTRFLGASEKALEGGEGGEDGEGEPSTQMS